MALQTVTPISRVGQSITTLLVAADAGLTDSWLNTGKELVIVQNGSGSTITVTLNYIATTDGQAITNRTISILAGAYEIFGPFPTALYNNQANGQASISYSAVTSVKIAVFSLTPSS